ncbi:DUF1353 domain-containing protein [Phaeocystidibacter luteus]|uniref:DUF1353 domain-containing protein n=1 Tax=Phaeocystidibacter luteus TaxID=911197 RepID=UPI00147964BA|nr:DUF1353 domain-containing protein [Phaeocystidibacter luteus]
MSDREYVLDTTYVTTFDYLGDGNLCRLTIDPGFRYDGASVPRLLWSISGIRPDGLNRAASLVHDYIYVNKGHIHFKQVELCWHGEWCSGQNIQISRSRCDRIFLEQLKEAGVKWVPRNLAYTAVRAAGWFLWMQKKRK